MSAAPRRLLEYLTRSDNRIPVLEALATGWAERASLQSRTGIPRSTLNRLLADFEDRALVTRRDHQYGLTPAGRILVERLRSVFDAIAATQRLLVVVRDPDLPSAFRDQRTSTLHAPTSHDPQGPIRRFSDLLAVASTISLAVPSGFDMGLLPTHPGLSIELVVPRDHPRYNKNTNEHHAGRWYVTTEEIPYVTGTIDDATILGVTDDDGTIRGFIESTDMTVHTWANATIATYKQTADIVDRQRQPI